MFKNLNYITKNMDDKINNLIKLEAKRQHEKLTMIASENYASKNVRDVLGSVLTNKYSEGEPTKRYYQGNEYIDEIEMLACKRALQVFGLHNKKWHVNVKATSASIANFAVLTGLLEPGDKILSMNLTHGGHLSHGWKLASGKPIAFSAKIFDVYYYGVEKKDQKFDYNNIEKIAKKIRPKIIISGGTAYTRDINYKKMASIAKKVNAYYLADVAHEAGLIAGKVLQSPFPYADVVTMSTQKTLRGPRGSIIICKQDLKNKIDKAIFPGLLGGPFNNNIGAIAVCLKEAQTIQFKNYTKQILKNAKFLAQELKKFGFNLVSGGTDKHLILIDLSNEEFKGTEAAKFLDEAGIICNKNTVPFETGSPMKPSGIRLGTPALTTRGMKEKEMKIIAKWIKEVLIDKKKPDEILKEVKRLTKKFRI